MDFFEAQDRARRRTQRLVLLFVLAVLGTIAASYFVAQLIRSHLGGGDRLDFPFGSPAWFVWDPQLFAAVAGATVAVVAVASLYKWSQMRHGGAAVAAMVGGRRVDPHTTNLHERRLLNVVEEMAIASGTPVPAVFVLDEEPGINAFAAGLTTSDAVVAVTRGTLEKLSRDELQGVVAHEFSHILNGDMRLNVRITAIVFGILALGLIGRGILRSLGRGRVRGGGRNKGGGVALVVAVGVALLVIGYVGFFFGRLIQAAVSRQREFLADASAVQFTRNPAGIGGALKKIGGYALGSRLLAGNAAEIGHFFFAQGLRSTFGGLWATHPPVDERIRAVEPRWDGRFFEPPTLVDVEREPLSAAGAARAAAPAAPARVPFQPAVVLAAIGALGGEQVRAAGQRLAAIPEELSAAAHDPAAAPAVVYALVIAAAPAPSDPALALVRRHASETDADRTRALLPAVAALDPAAKLPLLQLGLPALRALEAVAFERFVATLDELVHADGEVGLFEFVLQKMLLHQLDRFRRPARAVEFHSFHPVAGDIALVLSAVAHAGAAGASPAAAAHAFAAGAARLKLLPGLALLDRSAVGVERLDSALDRLAGSSLPIRQAVLGALVHTLGSDGTVTVPEAELYRAVAATFDCPAPAMATA